MPRPMAFMPLTSLKRAITVVPVDATLSVSVAFSSISRRSLTTTGLLMFSALAAGLAYSSTAPAIQISPRTRSSNSQSEFAGTGVSRPRKPLAEKISVLCVDADGKPVPHAEVYLFQERGGEKRRYIPSGPFQSDEHGKALCSDAIFTDEDGNFDRWTYARVPGRLLGVARAAKWTNRAAFNSENRVILQPSHQIEGQVKVPAGFDPTKVMVRTRVLHITTGTGFFDYQSFPREDHFPGLDNALPDRFDCRPDKAGRIHFSDVPVRGMFTLITVGEGLAEAQWRNEGKTVDGPIELTIAKESLVTGRVLSPDGKPAAGVEVFARLSPPPQRKVYYLSSFRAQTDEDGAFALHGLPQIDFVMHVRDLKKRGTFRPLENQLVEPDKDPHLTLRLETGTLVTGRVLDPDGKPVHGAAISAVADTRLGPGLDDDMTESSGDYQLRLPTGKARLYFNSLPDGFAYPRPPVVKDLDIEPNQPDIKNLNFTLQRQAKKPGR